MRKLVLAALTLSAIGCTKDEPVSEPTTDDPSARTTTAISPMTPEELAAKCDVPMYPGATAPQGMSHMPTKDAEGAMRYELVLATKDTPQKVADFYAGKLHLESKIIEGQATVMGNTPKKNAVIIAAGSEAGQTIIRVKAIAYSH